jgi:2-polyprenyl-3-methyl-5-hydroxy-6-metoxy-1,4-benzoquinol methylase
MKPLDRVLQRIRVRTVSPFIKRGSRLLDIGCAEGVLYQQIRRLDKYVGVDPDAPITAPWPNARFIRDTFPTSKLDPSERFDVITALAVLEHVPPHVQPRFAQSCAQLVVPGGCVALTVPSPIVDSILKLLKSTFLLDGMRDDQHYGFDPAGTRALFEPYGFHMEGHRRFELGLNHLFVFRRLPG